MSKPEIATPEQKKFIVQSIRGFFPKAEILVFGSRVNATARKYSDLDIALKSSTPIDIRSLNLLREKFSNSDLPFHVDICDFGTLPNSIIQQIRAVGVNW